MNSTYSSVNKVFYFLISEFYKSILLAVVPTLKFLIDRNIYWFKVHISLKKITVKQI